jgi:capsular polysaccharide export protein
VEQGDIISWIEAVDEVHTLTSTVGFEALMRNKPVFTYGLPFYAGWGLTEDWLDCERRTATRTLEELVYAVLIEYPTYLNPKTGEYTTAHNAAQLLADPDFTYDARPLYIKLLASLKSIYNRFIKRRMPA